MAEVPNELIYELNAMRAQRAVLLDDIADIKRRMTALEFSAGNLSAREANHYAAQSSRLNRIDARLERIERRLELADA